VPSAISDKTEQAAAVKKLALVGNPNVGKSVIFNRLTGKYVAVSNYPGTTVDVSRGKGAIAGVAYQVTDTPGVNSLIPHSEDERVTRDVLLTERPDVVIQVLDAKNLKRALLLTLELAEYRLPMVVALNMMDEALDRGVRIDRARLEKLLGVPVVETVATTGEGISDLKKAVARAAAPSLSVPYAAEIRRSLANLDNLWPAGDAGVNAINVALLSGDDTALTWAPTDRPGAPAADVIWKAVIKERAAFVRAPRYLIFEAREVWIADAVGQVMSRVGGLSSAWTAKFGNWCMRPWPGYLIAAAILYGVYQFVGVFGAGTAVDFLENTIFGAYLTPAATRLIEAVTSNAFIHDILVGPYGVISMAFTYAFALILPIVTTFFLAFGLLEDSGYLPRLSVMLDRVFRVMGLNGRAVLPMVLGLGCDTMATMTTRILDTKKERIIVTVLLSLTVPCSAQLAVILGMTAGLSAKVLVLWLGILVGTTLGVGWAAARFLPGSRSTFVMEIPPIRRPLLRNLYFKIKTRLKWYMWEVVPLFVWGTLLLFFMDRLKILGFLERMCAPVVQAFLGLPAEATQAFIVGFLRRDYGAAGLYNLQKQGLMDLRQVTVSLILITLFLPCIAQWLILIRERGWKISLGITAFVLVVALLIAGGVNGLLGLWPGLIS
jgi:ferrous iron transport protein B